MNANQVIAAWHQTCRSLASMPNLQNLSVTLRQDYSFIEPLADEKIATLVAHLLEPLKFVKVAEGGRFDVIASNWRLPEAPLSMSDAPFQIMDRTCYSPGDDTDLAVERRVV